MAARAYLGVREYGAGRGAGQGLFTPIVSIAVFYTALVVDETTEKTRSVGPSGVRYERMAPRRAKRQGTFCLPNSSVFDALVHAVARGCMGCGY